MDIGELPKISADSQVAEPRFLWFENLPPAGAKDDPAVGRRWLGAGRSQGAHVGAATLGGA